MKKRVLALSLAVVMCITMLPDTALAAQNTSESEPVYLGTEAEYQSTIDAMFDENGLREVAVGYNSNDGELYHKVGLADKYGNIVLQPIYDKIVTKAEYFNGTNHSSTRSSYFISGYAQVVRDGKMGLINTKGEEVVPCQYDYVGLPSEGICRVFNLLNANKSTYYLGYWSLEKNKEIVAPNKYYTSCTHKFLKNADTGEYWKKKEGDYLCYNDFIDGYAMVCYGDGDSIDSEVKNQIFGTKKVTVIDKNGKDIYGKTYAVSFYDTTSYQDYPQKGPYLSFYKGNVDPADYKNTEVYKAWKSYPDIKRGELKLGASNFTGLAGPKGVVIPAVYTSDHHFMDADFDGDGTYEGSYLWFERGSMEIIPDKKLFIASNAINPQIDTYAPSIVNDYGLLNFKGKKVIPFGDLSGAIKYDYENHIFLSRGNIYNAAGKVISKRKYNMDPFFYNGYNLASTTTGGYSQKNNGYVTTWYAVKADGTESNLTKALGLGKYERLNEVSKFNTRGYFWLKDKSGKWGLVNFKGKKVLPFEYDSVSSTEWHKGKKGYAIVTKNGKSGIVNNEGKEVVPCIYDGISDQSRFAESSYDQDLPSIIQVEGKDGKGLVEIATGKIIVPAKYESVRAFASYRQQNLNYFDTGAYYVELGGKTMLLDKDGNEVFSTTNKFHEALNGLYRYNDNTGYIDCKGHMIIPGELEKTYNLEIGDTYTIYVKDKMVYRVSANYLNLDYRFKPYQSNSSLSNQEINTYAENQRAAHKKAYDQASANPKKPPQKYKEPFVAFISDPSKTDYRVGEAFDSTGFKAEWVDVYGTKTDISSEIYFVINGKKIDNGYIFTTTGSISVRYYHKGKNLFYFKINVTK